MRLPKGAAIYQYGRSAIGQEPMQLSSEHASRIHMVLCANRICLQTANGPPIERREACYIRIRFPFKFDDAAMLFCFLIGVS
jgi:hypothetical protein